MGSSSDNFDSLQKLLRLKRHEQPVPRYFRDFSSRVICRIEAGEARVRTSWWERFGVDLRPILTAAAGMAACALVVVGLVSTLDADTQNLAIEAAAMSPAILPGFAGAVDESLPAMDYAAGNSTNPIVGSFSSPFRIEATPVSYQFGR